MDYKRIAQNILINVGGKENIKDVTHCFTRLRFVLHDDAKANKEVIERQEGVISVVRAGGQFQVVCGAKVTQIYDALIEVMEGVQIQSNTQENKNEKINNTDNKNVENKKDKNKQRRKNLGNSILQTIAQIFTPLVPAIAAAGLIKGLLTAAKLIMQNNGVDISTTDTYTILYAASQVIFYFFPIFLAMTAAKALKCNQVIAMVIAGTLVYPAIDTMIQDVATNTTLFGLPVIKGAWQIGDSVKVFSYTESVIPIILAVVVMAYLEKLLKKVIPEVLQLILVPGLELLIMLPLTLSLLGPIGIYIGNVIQVSYDAVIGLSPVLGGALIGGLWGVFVIFGAHRALLPIGLNDVALNGHQNILAFAGAANFAQGGAALGIMLKTKSKELKQVAASGTVAATLVGVTEPAIYGCNLRLKKPMICAIIAGAVGGAIMGFGGVYGDAFANNGVLTIFTYAAFGMTKFIFYLVGIVVAYFGAAALTYIIGFEDDVDSNHTNITSEAKHQSVKTFDEKRIMLTSPIEGLANPLSEVKDEAFATGQLGQGVGISPRIGEVVAPYDCTVSVIYQTLHAIGLELDNGVELLIHIGIDTVDLNGKYFTKHVNEGDHITKGTKIISFDIEGIKKEGYDITTPVIVTNTSDYKLVTGITGEVNNDANIIQIEVKDE